MGHDLIGRQVTDGPAAPVFRSIESSYRWPDGAPARGKSGEDRVPSVRFADMTCSAMVPNTALGLRPPDVRVLSLGSAAPLRRVLLAQRQDKVYAPAEVAFHSRLLEIARERTGDFL
jgi:hypothetical protein